MRTKIILFALTTSFAAASASAEQAPASAVLHVKSKEQIRCELLSDCKPLPATRAWITRTGGIENDRNKISANLASIRDKGPVKVSNGRGKPAQAKITAVRSSDLFINFVTASWDIDDTAFAQATELYAALTPQEWVRHRFEIAGHTDAVGGPAYNDDLSQKRAQAVVDLLVARGVSRSQLVVKGYGFRHPIDGLERTDGRNRRVEIKKLD